MRPALFAFFFLSACSSDKFTNDAGTGGPDGATDGGTGCGHELCDDFDQPGEQPGNNPPWPNKSGMLGFAMGNNSKQALEAQALPFGSYVKWSAKTGAKGISCAGDVWLEPIASDGGADTRDRTVAVIEVDGTADGGTGTYLFTVTANDVKGVGGGALGPGILGSWGGSMAVVPTRTWVPLKFEATHQGTTLTLSTTFGPAMFSSGVTIATPTQFRINLGAAGGSPTAVRWDNVTCDSK